MPDEVQPAKRKYVRKAKAECNCAAVHEGPCLNPRIDDVPPGLHREGRFLVRDPEPPVSILEVRLTIPPDLPGLSATTTLNVSDPMAKSKGLALRLHRIGVLATYADGSLYAIFPYAQIKRIRFDREPE